MDSVIIFLIAAYLNIGTDSAGKYYHQGWYLPDTSHLFSTAWIEHQAHVLNVKEPTYKREKKFPLFYGSFTHYSLPCAGKKTSGFGKRWGKSHYGIDLGGDKGDCIYSAFDGVVRYARYNKGGYGNLVVIRHYNDLETYYAHLAEISVKPGSKIKAGTIIGKMGSTGHSTGDHLHFEIRILGYPIDPELLFTFSKKGILANIYQIDSYGVSLKKTTSPFCEYEIYLDQKTILSVQKEKKDSIQSPRNMRSFGNMMNQN